MAFTGVQILFAFLLTLAFTQRFQELDAFQVTVYTVALMSTALATMTLITPVSFHRIVFRRHQKSALVVAADRLLVIGLAILVPAISSAVLLSLDVVLGLWAGDRGQFADRPRGPGHLVCAASDDPPLGPGRDAIARSRAPAPARGAVTASRPEGGRCTR